MMSSSEDLLYGRISLKAQHRTVPSRRSGRTGQSHAEVGSLAQEPYATSRVGVLHLSRSALGALPDQDCYGGYHGPAFLQLHPTVSQGCERTVAPRHLEVHCTYNLLRNCSHNLFISPITTVTLDIIGL